MTMRDRPIIFSAPMIRALLDGRKTQTRRIGKLRKGVTLDAAEWEDAGDGVSRIARWRAEQIAMPYEVGNRFWVRETWCPVNDAQYGGQLWIDYRATPRYEASQPAGWHEAPNDPEALHWRSPIHMPRWASRLTLIVESVKVERLQAISEEDARAEGVTPICDHGVGDRDLHWCAFHMLWDSIHGRSPHCWLANPWVVAITFRTVRANIDAAGAA